jgi:hypothetical protein
MQNHPRRKEVAEGHPHWGMWTSRRIEDPRREGLPAGLLLAHCHSRHHGDCTHLRRVPVLCSKDASASLSCGHSRSRDSTWLDPSRKHAGAAPTCSSPLTSFLSGLRHGRSPKLDLSRLCSSSPISSTYLVCQTPSSPIMERSLPRKNSSSSAMNTTSVSIGRRGATPHERAGRARQRHDPARNQA